MFGAVVTATRGRVLRTVIGATSRAVFQARSLFVHRTTS
jgi:hypothetical protein